MFEYVLVVAPVLLLSTLLVFVQKKTRPEGVIVEYGIHYNATSAFTVQDLTKAIQTFDSVWFSAYPEHKKAFRRAAKNLNIHWTNKKIQDPQGLVVARMSTIQDIEIWIGPKLPGNRRNIIYTGLLDQLIKLTMVVNNIVPNTNTPTVNSLVEEMKSRIG
jgi:hypothetical protein